MTYDMTTNTNPPANTLPIGAGDREAGSSPGSASRSLFTKEQLEADIAFLVERSSRSGSFTCDRRRSWGSSSNALVEVAYGGKQSSLPNDWDDYAACVRAFRLLPRHRVSQHVRDALHKARAEVEKNYPEYANGPLRKIARLKRAAEDAARSKRRKR